MGMLMKHELHVTETPTSGTSIFCQVRLLAQEGRSEVVYGGQMYFVCNQEKKIHQWFRWMECKSFREAVTKLGYTFNPKADEEV